MAQGGGFYVAFIDLPNYWTSWLRNADDGTLSVIRFPSFSFATRARVELLHMHLRGSADALITVTLN